MRITKDIKLKIIDAVKEPFEEDRVIKVSNLIRLGYNLGVRDTLRDRGSIINEVSGVKDKIIEGLLSGCEVTINPVSLAREVFKNVEVKE